MIIDNLQINTAYRFADVAFSCPYCGSQFKWAPMGKWQESYSLPIEYDCDTVIVYDQMTDGSGTLVIHNDCISRSDKCKLIGSFNAKEDTI